jgi:hypothetical protein
MIKECILAKTGIQFDMDYLKDALDFDFDDLVTEMKEKEIEIADLGEAYAEIENYAQESFGKKEKEIEIADLGEAYAEIENYTQESFGKKEQAETDSIANGSPQTHFPRFRHYMRDVVDQIFDQLVLVWVWWILEILPLWSTYQDPEGNWVRLRT